MIGKWPLVTILIAIGVAGLCGIGMLKFVQENRGEKLWNPQDSEALAHKAVVENRYPVASRMNVALFEGGNVLESQFIKAVSWLVCVLLRCVRPVLCKVFQIMAHL